MTALPPLPEARWLWASGSRPYCDSYSADQMRAYAEKAVAAERERIAQWLDAEYEREKQRHNYAAWYAGQIRALKP